MPFTDYAAIGDVARAYQIVLRDEKFVALRERPMSDILREELAFAGHHAAYKVSEAAVCENLIYPILREVWKSYLQDLMLWSHEQLRYDNDLSGTPDYFVSHRWAQCVAALLAAQKLNNLPELTLYGITTNRRSWEFGKLEDATFTKDTQVFVWSRPEELCAALRFIFEQCQLQVSRLPRSA
jgi:hypothetical protein